jgi:hypothetical protein
MRIQFEKLNFCVRRVITNSVLPIIIKINNVVHFASEVENK